jgi:hypothetical protein
VLLAPAESWGVLDIRAEVKVRWYTDEARTSPTAVVPYSTDWPLFGIRLYVTKAGGFKKECQIGEDTAALSSVYPTSVLTEMTYPAMDVIYWATGTLPGDLYFSEENSIEVSDTGLPISLGREVAEYPIANPLNDIDTSSSSESSISSPSSLNSSSSSSSST